MNQQNRREFLKGTIAGTGTVLGAGAILPNQAVAVEPPTRNGHPYFKLSLAGYSFNRFLLKGWTSEQLPNAKLTLEKFFEFCAEQGLEGIEPTSYYFPKMITPEYLNSLKNLAFRLGLDISGTAIGNNFCLPAGAARDQQLKQTRDWIDHASILGAPVIRIFGGKIPKGVSEEQAVKWCVECIDQSLEYAATKGVFLALENHGGITTKSETMLNIIKGVGPSEWFGVNFDSGNFSTADPYADLEKIAPYAINAQLKVSVKVNGKKERTDFARVIDILKKANYRGYLVLEYEEKEDPFKMIPEILKEIRGLIAT